LATEEKGLGLGLVTCSPCAASGDGARGDGASAGGHASDRSPVRLLRPETGEYPRDL